jgi:hypothetical protein
MPPPDRQFQTRKKKVAPPDDVIDGRPLDLSELTPGSMTDAPAGFWRRFKSAPPVDKERNFRLHLIFDTYTGKIVSFAIFEVNSRFDLISAI